MEKQARTAAFLGEGLQEADHRSRLPRRRSLSSRRLDNDAPPVRGNL